MHRIESSLVIILHLSSFHYVQNCAITRQLPNVQLSDGNITITLQILNVVNECIFSRAFNPFPAKDKYICSKQKLHFFKEGAGA